MQEMTVLQAESVQNIAETKPALYEAMNAVAKHQIKKRRIDEQRLINENALTQQLTASLALCAGERTMEKLNTVMRAILNLAESEIDDALDEIMKR